MSHAGSAPLRNSLVITDKGMQFFERLYAAYRRMYEAPTDSSPKFIVNTPREPLATVAKMLDDPLLMLENELDALRGHLRLQDDRAPTVRVQLGSAQVAAAFGCLMHVFADSPPASSGPVMKSAAEVFRMRKPPLESGLYAEVSGFTEIWLENLPPGVRIQHPDIGSPFNNAHLIRGDGIAADCRDDPVAVDLLLDLVADYMIDVTRWLNGMIGSDAEWFFDRGALWKGQAGISNSPKQTLSPEFYAEHVLLRDMRFIRAIGGGCIYYDGEAGETIRHILRAPELTGLGFHSQYHDLWEVAEAAPENVTLLTGIGRYSPEYGRLVSGDWPDKRNIIFHISASSIEEGKEMLETLRKSVPGCVD